MLLKITISILFFCCALRNDAQVETNSVSDTTITSSIIIDSSTTPLSKDTIAPLKTVKAPHDARIATRRSAIIPGWGQAYNKEYWKIPVVYAALGITAGTFFYNNTWYKRCKFAYELVVDENVDRYNEIDPKLQGLTSDPSSLEFYRNSFRKDRDYSVLYFLLAWGLNVVDATVFGNLKDFDVSDDLSMQLQPIYNPTNRQAEFGLVLSQKNKKATLLPVQ